ncbi:MAG: hypothetical protein HUU43_09230 [Ignavibacteriaceae bacterium]|nr:hypothetical protein [Ignavibacteriaceae bacterium]NUM71020.1 hypothetical protein [Ignavibacteriaceae bacterium]
MTGNWKQETGGRKTGHRKQEDRKQETGKQETGIQETGSRKTGGRKTGGRKTGGRKTGGRKQEDKIQQVGDIARTVTPPEFSGLSVHLCCNTGSRRQENRKQDCNASRIFVTVGTFVLKTIAV